MQEIVGVGVYEFRKAVHTSLVFLGYLTTHMADVLSIYLLTHNRPQKAIEAIRSILSQSDDRFQLIVSDNSDNDELSSLLDGMGSSIEYIYRNKDGSHYSAFEHFNLCISEVKTRYFSLLHDDDLILPNYVSGFWLAQKSYPKAIAFGRNARIRHLNGKDQMSFLGESDISKIPSARDLAWRYFGKHQLGIAPFPFYTYNKEEIGDTQFSSQYGKYGDVAWLLDLANRGEMVWVNDPAGIYRHHGGNDSNLESTGDRLRFLSYLKKGELPDHSLMITLYRLFLYKKILSTGNMKIGSKRYKLLSQYQLSPPNQIRLLVLNVIALIAKCKVRVNSFSMKLLGRSDAIR